jgi:hypothetical protein
MKNDNLCLVQIPASLFFPFDEQNVKHLVIELHHQPNFGSRQILKILKQIKPLKVALISRKAEVHFNQFNLDIETFILEMAVPESFIHQNWFPLESPHHFFHWKKSK